MLAFTLGRKLCIHSVPKLLFLKLQTLVLERFLPEGNDKRSVLEKEFPHSGSEDCKSEKSCDVVRKSRCMFEQLFHHPSLEASAGHCGEPTAKSQALFQIHSVQNSC